MKSRLGLVILLTVAFLATSLTSGFAQGIDDGFDDFDSLFQDEFMVEDLEEPDAQATSGTGRAAFESLLSTDAITLGGRFSGSLTSVWRWSEYPISWNSFTQDGNDGFFYGLSTDLFIDARPSSTFRVFTKFRAGYPFQQSVTRIVHENTPPTPPNTVTVPQVNLQLLELFTDITYRDTFLIRFGKQTVNWGVGRFFSPADIISLTPIDVDEPEAEREGPAALRINFPVGLHSFDAYIIGDESVKTFRDLGLAARGEFYINPVELGLGVGWQKDRPFRVVSTLRMPWRDWNFFGEARVSFGREKKIIAGPTQYEVDNNPYFAGTLGFLYFNNDSKFTMVAQYFFQGEGYTDSNLLTAAALGVSNNDISASTLSYFGQHHSILSLGLTELFHEDLSTNVLWQASWSDLSGLVSTSLSWRAFRGLSLSGAVHVGYGDRPSEFGGFDVPGSGLISPRNPYGRLGFSLTASFGQGRF
jgi:hypothetical protein